MYSHLVLALEQDFTSLLTSSSHCSLGDSRRRRLQRRRAVAGLQYVQCDSSNFHTRNHRSAALLKKVPAVGSCTVLLCLAPAVLPLATTVPWLDASSSFFIINFLFFSVEMHRLQLAPTLVQGEWCHGCWYCLLSSTFPALIPSSSLILPVQSIPFPETPSLP